MKITIEITDDFVGEPRSDVVNAIRYELKQVRSKYSFSGSDLSSAITIVDQEKVSLSDWKQLCNHLNHIMRALPDGCQHRATLEDELRRARRCSTADVVDVALHARVLERAMQDREAMLVQRGVRLAPCELAMLRRRMLR